MIVPHIFWFGLVSSHIADDEECSIGMRDGLATLKVTLYFMVCTFGID